MNGFSAGHLYQTPAQTRASFTDQLCKVSSSWALKILLGWGFRVSVSNPLLCLTYITVENYLLLEYLCLIIHKIYLLFTVEVSEALYQHYLLRIQEFSRWSLENKLWWCLGVSTDVEKVFWASASLAAARWPTKSSKGLLGAVTGIPIILIGFSFGNTFLT